MTAWVKRYNTPTMSDTPNPAPQTRRILVLFAHPALEKSRINRRMVAAIQDLPGVTFHDLYEAYPDFLIRVEEEQRLMEEHDLVVFQHPFFWYSTPAILKEWQDLVLEHGWAYGSTGKALAGKVLLSVITTGGREMAYGPEGLNRYTMRELLQPIEQTARLCGMHYPPPFVAHGTHSMKEDAMEAHARDYRRLLVALRDNTFDLDATDHLPRLNIDLDALLGSEGEDHAS
jgi:glutathione-regulated potassium-efflux system ancillary protein KefG